MPWPFSGPFAPLGEGVVEVIEPNGVHRWQLNVLDLGTLKVVSGKVLACDPFMDLPDGLVYVVPKGDHPVRVTIADVSDMQDGSHKREAYLSLVIRAGEEASHRVVMPEKQRPLQDPNAFYGVRVGAGTVAFADAENAKRLLPKGNLYEQLFENGKPDAWFAQMDSESPLPKGYANIVLPKAKHGENIILSHSGWGDGFYPVIGTFGADGGLTGLHIDLQVVGEFTE